ncbi:MAG TPA: phosphomannomutase, partial [Polyangiaceae bacterium]|nr:phosphomannomutase [Polyangiaceae bacterium]
MSDHVFREYDIRGVAERDLSDDFAERLGRGLAEMLAPEGRAPTLVVARDCRLSGERLENALVRGLVAGGAQVVRVGVGPTPLMYFGVHHLNADGGIMVTGSHNPAEDNGFKIMKGKASFFGTQLVALRARTKQPFGEVAGGSARDQDISDAYVEALTSRVELGPHRFPFVIDAGNGGAGPL